MSASRTPTAIEKRAQNQKALAPFRLHKLYQKLPTIETFSSFEISVRLFDYSALEPLLAAHIYMASAKGQVPFHPVSMYLLSLYRRGRHLSRHEVLRILRRPKDGQTLRRCAGFGHGFPSESGLRYFEGQLSAELQMEINALQLDALHQAGLLPIKPGADEKTKAPLSFEGMLHEARSRLRCSSVKAGCYEPPLIPGLDIPRPDSYTIHRKVGT